jgi:hypothetical protein
MHRHGLVRGHVVAHLVRAAVVPDLLDYAEAPWEFDEITDPETGEKKKVQHPPGYQFFTCPATAPKGNGYTFEHPIEMHRHGLVRGHVVAHLVRAAVVPDLLDYRQLSYVDFPRR